MTKETIDEAYYRQWLAALENIADATGLLDQAEIEQRVEAWRAAYWNTPHGYPVALAGKEAIGAATHNEQEHEHDHDLGRPLAVSPPITNRNSFAL